MTRTSASVVFYISGHGFGHASRAIEIINALTARCPQVRVHLRSSVSRWLCDLTISAPFTLDSTATDVGVVQIDALTPDIETTLDRAKQFHADAAGLIEREALAIREAGASLVLADVPPVAFAAAARADVPAVAISNFTWDWIYDDYERALQRVPDLSRLFLEWQRHAEEGWRLPMHGGFGGFDRLRDLPFVARRAKRSRDDVRTRLGWPHDVPIVLTSFGGVGMGPLPLERAAAGGRMLLVGCREPVAGDGGALSVVKDHVATLDERRLYDEGLRYEDVVGAVDVVVTKPGYGIIAECIANDTALLYTSRGRFAEYDVLVTEMPRWLRTRFIGREALLAGEWSDAVDALLSQAPPRERARINGADIAATWIADRLAR